MKIQNPICPECGSPKTKKNGISGNPCGDYLKQRFTCKECDKRFLKPLLPELMRLKPINRLRSNDLNAIRDYLLRYPWEVIQDYNRVKQQTIKKKLRVIFKEKLFDELKKRMLKQFIELDEDNFEALKATLEKDANGEPVFRCAGQVVGKEFRERSWEKTD